MLLPILYCCIYAILYCICCIIYLDQAGSGSSGRQVRARQSRQVRLQLCSRFICSRCRFICYIFDLLLNYLLLSIWYLFAVWALSWLLEQLTGFIYYKPSSCCCCCSRAAVAVRAGDAAVCCCCMLSATRALLLAPGRTAPGLLVSLPSFARLLWLYFWTGPGPSTAVLDQLLSMSRRISPYLFFYLFIAIWYYLFIIVYYLFIVFNYY